MSEFDPSSTDSTTTAPGGEYPLRKTAEMLNDRLGLYLSPEQQRGLAIGLLVGITLGAAVISWGVGSAIRDR